VIEIAVGFSVHYNVKTQTAKTCFSLFHCVFILGSNFLVPFMLPFKKQIPRFEGSTILYFSPTFNFDHFIINFD
jgi:hypothetical protein